MSKKAMRKTIILSGLSSLLLCGFISKQDERYINYFIQVYTAKLFQEKNFQLTHMKPLYARGELEKIELAFSCYKSLTQQQARAILIEIAETLVKKINIDKTFQNHILLRPFSVDQLKITLKADTILGRTIENLVTCHTATLNNSTLNYQTYRSQKDFWGEKKEYTEEYTYARMLIGQSISFEQLMHEEGLAYAEKNEKTAQTTPTKKVKIHQELIERENLLGAFEVPVKQDTESDYWSEIPEVVQIITPDAKKLTAEEKALQIEEMLSAEEREKAYVRKLEHDEQKEQDEKFEELVQRNNAQDSTQNIQANLGLKQKAIAHYSEVHFDQIIKAPEIKKEKVLAYYPEVSFENIIPSSAISQIIATVTEEGENEVQKKDASQKVFLMFYPEVGFDSIQQVEDNHGSEKAQERVNAIQKDTIEQKKEVKKQIAYAYYPEVSFQDYKGPTPEVDIIAQLESSDKENEVDQEEELLSDKIIAMPYDMPLDREESEVDTDSTLQATDEEHEAVADPSQESDYYKDLGDVTDIQNKTVAQTENIGQSKDSEEVLTEQELPHLTDFPKVIAQVVTKQSNAIVDRENKSSKQQAGDKENTAIAYEDEEELYLDNTEEAPLSIDQIPENSVDEYIIEEVEEPVQPYIAIHQSNEALIHQEEYAQKLSKVIEQPQQEQIDAEEIYEDVAIIQLDDLMKNPSRIREVVAEAEDDQENIQEEIIEEQPAEIDQNGEDDISRKLVALNEINPIQKEEESPGFFSILSNTISDAYISVASHFIIESEVNEHEQNVPSESKNS